MPEPLGLAGYPAGDLLQISGDVREFNPKAAEVFSTFNCNSNLNHE